MTAVTAPADARMHAEATPLAGRTAYVTGAAGGMGQVIARRLAQAGASLVLGDLRADLLAPVVDAIRADGGSAHAIPGDMADEADVARAAHAMRRHLGGCDILVNVAAILPPPTPLETLDVAIWDRVMAVNLRAPFLTCRHFGAMMLDAGTGAIVNIASIAATMPNAVGAYGASKAGVVALTRQIAVEWGPRGIRANIVSPGLIRTPMSAAAYADPVMLARRRATTALDRIGEPEDVAEAVAWLAGGQARYVTGQEIVVDGGFLHTALMRVQAR